MRDPFAPETHARENVCMRNTPGLDDVLPCFEVPPEIRIGDRLRRARKDDQHKNKNEQPATGAERAHNLSLCPIA